jgi:hypothetical protein
MAGQLRFQKHPWRLFVLQVALLCSLMLHGLGLLHKHGTPTQQDTCAACQVVNSHAALDLPDADYSSLPLLLVLFFLVVPWHRDVAPGATFFARPPSRAPPFSILS